MNPILRHLKEHADLVRANHSQRYFKTGKGEYGEGDVFLGVSVPVQRSISKKLKDEPLKIVLEALKDKYHEARLTAVLILVFKYPKDKATIFDLYLKHKRYLNNWDIIDSSAPRIVGDYLLDKKHDLLFSLASSEHLWDRRIAVLSSFAFINHNRFSTSLSLAKILLHDQHDLIHKAVGWMLREIGKKDEMTLRAFLDVYTGEMPRTMLRYAIERLPDRLKYLQK